MNTLSKDYVENRSDYQWWIKDSVLLIEDLNGGKSVTNDMAKILLDLDFLLGSLEDRRIIYKDSEGIWDGVAHDGKFLKGFYPIGATNSDAALQQLRGIKTS